jgi:hypothetical protein
LGQAAHLLSRLTPRFGDQLDYHVKMINFREKVLVKKEHTGKRVNAAHFMN